MKKIYSVVIINLLILFFLFLLYIKMFNDIFLYIVLFILILINIILIYRKSNSFDEKEIKQKLILHKIKNSLSVILGYNEAFKDNLITKEVLESEINKEIEFLINIIKNEVYRK